MFNKELLPSSLHLKKHYCTVCIVHVKGKRRVESIQRRESWIDCDLLCWHLGEKQKLKTHNIFLCPKLHSTLKERMWSTLFLLQIWHFMISYSLVTYVVWLSILWSALWVFCTDWRRHEKISCGFAPYPKVLAVHTHESSDHYLTAASQSIFNWGARRKIAHS